MLITSGKCNFPEIYCALLNISVKFLISKQSETDQRKDLEKLMKEYVAQVVLASAYVLHYLLSGELISDVRNDDQLSPVCN